MFSKSITTIWIVFTAGIIFLNTSACTTAPPAQSQADPSVFTVASRPQGDDATGYESPPVLPASNILPADLRQGPHHRVEDEVDTFGFTNSYRLVSDYFIADVQGTGLLRKRVQEVRALKELNKMKKTSAFGNAAKKAATAPLSFAKNLITRPVDTISGVPRGLWRYVNRVGAMVSGERNEVEDSVAQELIGFSAAKRKIAHKLGVDVYSTNLTLQKELNSVSWASFSGGFAVGLAMTPFPVVKMTKTADRMTHILRDNAPEDLRDINREKLERMQVREPIIDTFLKHPHYSPRHETILVAALAALAGAKNIEKFIHRANTAESFEDAFLFQRMAEMLAEYHEKVAPIKEILIGPARGLPLALTGNNRVVMALLADYISWTRPVADSARDFIQANNRVAPERKAELWITGRFSPKAEKGLEDLGISVNEKAFERFRET